GASAAVNAGPFLAIGENGPLVVAHNGNVINAAALRALLLDRFALTPHSDSDTELLAHLLAVAPGRDWLQRVRWMASLARGSYSLVILTGEQIIGVRDPMGN